MEQRRVSRIPHSIYRYPARFAPEFAREAILSFTRVGDLVLDPFSGGGTTITEAIKLGRRAAAIDISALAAFSTRAKTTPLSVHDVSAISDWVEGFPSGASVKAMANCECVPDSPFVRHLDYEARTFFRTLLEQIRQLPTSRQRQFARLILLATGQASLDCKTVSLTVSQRSCEFRRTLASALVEFGAFWREAAETHSVAPCQLTRVRRILNRSSTGCETDKRIPRKWLPAQLVLMSPPYPGVH